MKLIKKISKFEENKGFSYTTEYSSEDIKEIPKWENIDNSWASKLVENEPEDVDYQCWYEVVNEDGDVIYCSDKFWERQN